MAGSGRLYHQTRQGLDHELLLLAVQLLPQASLESGCYFGFTNDLLPILVPCLQLNSLGLTTLVHPNTDDPRADHLYYTLWVNRSRPVNAYAMKPPRDKDGRVRVEKILPNVTPTVKLEIGS
jgi:hypothetical protein